MTTVRKRSWAEGDIEAGNARVHYYRTGLGEQPPVVLAHGFSDNGLCWRRMAQALEADFDVVMVDARNHGRSTTAAVGVSKMADDLAAVVVGLALQRPTVVGHSIGAATAAEMAAGIRISQRDLSSRIHRGAKPRSNPSQTRNAVSMVSARGWHR